VSAKETARFCIVKELTIAFSNDDFDAFDMQHMKNMQLAAEKAAEERLLIQRLDEDFARKVQSQEGNFQSSRPQPSYLQPSSSKPPGAYSSASGSSRNAFDRMSGIRPPQSQSQATLQAINPSTSFSTHRQPTAFKKETHLKHEPSSFSNLSGSRTGPGNGVSNYSKKPSSFTPLDDSDSDIEVISSTAFRSNGRYQQSRDARDRSYQAALGDSRPPVKNEQSALSWAMYGGQSNPHPWMDSSQPLVSSGRTTMLALAGQPDPRPWMDSSQSLVSSGRPTMSGSAGQYVYQTPSFDGNTPAISGSCAPDVTNPFQTASGIKATYFGYYNDLTRPGLNSFDSSLTNPFGRSFDGYFADVKPTFMGQPGMTPFTDIDGIANSSAYTALGGSYMENMAEQYDYIMNDPRKTNDEIKSLLENIQPDVELPKENREGTPDGLKYPLVSIEIRIPYGNITYQIIV
jgi:hypothetical protein